MKITQSTLQKLIREELEAEALENYGLATYGMPETEKLAAQMMKIRKEYEDAYKRAIAEEDKILYKDMFGRSAQARTAGLDSGYVNRDKAIEDGDSAHAGLVILDRAFDKAGGMSDGRILRRLDFPLTEEERDAAMEMYEGKITKSALQKIIREELEAVMNEAEFDDRFNALQNARADILNVEPPLSRSSLSIKQREGLPNLAIKVVDGMSVAAARAELNKLAKPKPMNEAVENAMLFKLVSDEGIVMTDADRKEFFANYLRRNGYTTADAIKDNRRKIAGELNRNRARQKAKN